MNVMAYKVMLGLMLIAVTLLILQYQMKHFTKNDKIKSEYFFC